MIEKNVKFYDVVVDCAANKEFVSQYNRLTGNNFSLWESRSPIEQAIDKATGYKGFTSPEVQKFITFVYEFVWNTALLSEKENG